MPEEVAPKQRLAQEVPEGRWSRDGGDGLSFILRGQGDLNRVLLLGRNIRPREMASQGQQQDLSPSHCQQDKIEQ